MHGLVRFSPHAHVLFPSTNRAEGGQLPTREEWDLGKGDKGGVGQRGVMADGRWDRDAGNKAANIT